MFTTTDMNDLFSDRNDITYSHDGDESEQIVSAGIRTRGTVFRTTTRIGTICALRDLKYGLSKNSECIIIEVKTYIEIGFCSPYRLMDAISAMVTFIVFCEELSGRPQNVNEVSLGVGDDRFEMYYISNRFSHPIESSAFSKRYFLSYIHDPDGFVSVLSKWLERTGNEWSDARRRFSRNFAKQMFYDPDRVMSAANVFDLLPSDSVGGPEVLNDNARGCHPRM